MKKKISLVASTVFIIFSQSCATSTSHAGYSDYMKCRYYFYQKELNKAVGYCEKAKSEIGKNRKIYKDLIQLYLHKNNLRKTNQLLSEYIKNFHSSKDYTYVSDMYLKLNETKKAKSLLLEAAKKFPDNEHILDSLVEAYIQEGDVKKAKQILEKLAKESQNPDVYYKLAKIYLLYDRNIPKAIKTLEKAYELDPYNSKVFILLAELYRQTGQLKKAENIYLHALKKYRDNPVILQRLLQLYVLEDDYQKAKLVIDKLLQVNPEGKDILLKAFFLYEKIGKIDEFIKKLKELEPELSDNPEFYSILAKAYADKGDLKNAVKYLQKAIELAPDNLQLKEELANLYVNLKQYDKALQVLNDIYLSNPQNYKILLEMADIEDKRRNTKKSVELAKEAIKLNPKDPVNYFMLAIYYDKLGNWKETEKNLKKAIQLRPNFADALNYLGYSYIIRREKVKEGLKLVKKALEYAPDNPAYLDSYGWGLYKLGEYKKAKEYLEKAYKKMKDDPVVLYHYGMVLLKLGEKEKAKKLFSKSLKLLKEMKTEPEAGITDKVKKQLESLK